MTIDAIVRGGAYAGKGMASFAAVLNERQAASVHPYVVSQGNTSIAFCQTDYPKQYPELFETACVKREAN